jgi:hypothetical protein
VQAGVDGLAEDSPPDVVDGFEDVERLPQIRYGRLPLEPSGDGPFSVTLPRRA